MSTRTPSLSDEASQKAKQSHRPQPGALGQIAYSSRDSFARQRHLNSYRLEAKEDGSFDSPLLLLQRKPESVFLL